VRSFQAIKETITVSGWADSAVCSVPLTLLLKYSTRLNSLLPSFKKHLITLLLGEEASLSIGNTSWRVSTMFTRSAITLPEVNGFG